MLRDVWVMDKVEADVLWRNKVEQYLQIQKKKTFKAVLH